MRREEYLELLDKFSILERLDERTTNIYHLVEKLEKYQLVQNGQIKTNTSSISRLKISLYTLVGFLAGAGILDATVWHKILGG